MRSDCAWTERVAAMVEEVVTIADRVHAKDDIAAAKLQIEARQWVVETYLLKAAKREKSESEPISVTINASADAELSAVP